MSHVNLINNLLVKLSQNRIINDELEKEICKLRNKFLNQTNKNDDVINILNESINALIEIKLKDKKVISNLKDYTKLCIYNYGKKPNEVWNPISMVDVGTNTECWENNIIKDIPSFPVSTEKEPTKSMSLLNLSDNKKYSTKVKVTNEKDNTHLSNKILLPTKKLNFSEIKLSINKNEQNIDISNVVQIFVKTKEEEEKIIYFGIASCSFEYYSSQKCLYLDYLNDDLEEIFFCTNAQENFNFVEKKKNFYILIKGEASAFYHPSIEIFILKFINKKDAEDVYHSIIK